MSGDSDKIIREPPPIESEFEDPDTILNMKDSSPRSSIPTNSIQSGWSPYFRYDSAYPDQVDAIDTFLEILGVNGYYAFEGACGTGKTLAALTASIHAIRNGGMIDSNENITTDSTFPHYSRAMVVTPVKQQLKQFIQEVRGMNRNLPSGYNAITATVLRGRRDMMPYAHTDFALFEDANFNDKIDDLRDNARELIKFESDIKIDWPSNVDVPAHSKVGYNWDTAPEEVKEKRSKYRYDPFRAKVISNRVMEMDAIGDYGGNLTIEGVETPYPKRIPTVDSVAYGEELNKADKKKRFDPFYVRFFVHGGSPPFGFSDAKDHVFDYNELFQKSLENGICPHETMAYFAKHADVTIGNYNHLFDPQTRLLTEGKIDLIRDDTIVIVDEAHQIEERVRGLLSNKVGLHSLTQAEYDVRILRFLYQSQYGRADNLLRGGIPPSAQDRATSIVREAMGESHNYTITPSDLKEIEEFFTFAREELIDLTDRKIQSEYDDWEIYTDKYGPQEHEIPLLSPDATEGHDNFTESVWESDKFTEGTFMKVYHVMLAADRVYERFSEDGITNRNAVGASMGRFWRDWMKNDVVTYHREIIIDPSSKDKAPDKYPNWVREWSPQFQLFNTIPRDELRRLFRKVGGGVLMSATLQPGDVFKEVNGIDEVPKPGDDEIDIDLKTEDDMREYTFEQYPLRFPASNRESIIVPLNKYKYKNRKNPTQDFTKMSPTRRQYAKTLSTLINTHGNILVAMPNYGEAKWAYEYLSDQVNSKEMYLDESSSALKTDETLERFFGDEPSVIFTSSRGTVTEGIDYDGDKLHMVIGVGVPLLPVNSPRIRAIKNAYDEYIDAGRGFETSLTIPAVRKVRQAIGRVIRGMDENGVRVLIDERYSSDGWDGVNPYLSEQEQKEFSEISPDNVGDAVNLFWENKL